MSQKTRRRMVPALLLALVLIVGFMTWATTTTGAEVDPCHENCSNAALACNFDCYANHGWNPTALNQCMLGCEAQLDACVMAC